MVKVHILGGFLMGSLFLASCKHDKPTSHEAPPNIAENEQLTSQELLRGFPLLALIEKPLWTELVQHEAIVSDPETSDQTREQAQRQIRTIADRLCETHPFSHSEDTISLGEVSYHRKTRQIELMARVNNLKTQQKGDQEDIELILCSQKGRTHESLFVTKARPLHLEILLHLAGYSKSDPPSQYQILISVPNHDPIKVDDLLVSKSQEPLPRPLLWEFSGSPFEDLYQPDLTGDFIICWHAHDSVLRVTDEKIASNETRLLAKQHPAIKPDMTVKIILVPVSQRK